MSSLFPSAWTGRAGSFVLREGTHALRRRTDDSSSPVYSDTHGRKSFRGNGLSLDRFLVPDLSRFGRHFWRSKTPLCRERKSF